VNTTLLETALKCVQKGWFIFPAKARAKEPDLELVPHWSVDSSNDAKKIAEWWSKKPNANICIDLGRSNLTVLDFDKGGVPAIGLPDSFTVTTGRGTHYYAQGTFKQGDMYLNGEHIGEVKSLGGYVVGPRSRHPDGPVYTPTNKPVVSLGDISSIVVRITQKPAVRTTPTKPEEKTFIPQGQIHPAMVSYAGRLRETLGLDREKIEELLLDWVHENCEGPIDENKVKAVARSICNYEKGNTTALLITGSTPVEEEVLDIDDTAQIPDMPEDAIVGGSLADICSTFMGNFPRAYAWPTILTVAGAMVPPQEHVLGTQTNLYCALVGPVGSGKSQAIEHARRQLGLPIDRYTDVKAGSAEGLLSKISEMDKQSLIRSVASEEVGGFVRARQMLVDLDEWSHLFAKANIENSSFINVLNTAFNKPDIHLVIANQKRIDIDCALSFIGGIVDDKVQECFGSASTSGFHDRFLFGLCPTVNPHSYLPFNPSDCALTDFFFSGIKPVPVKINESVWKLAGEWKRMDPTLGRAVEVTVRCASIVASFDGRGEIHAADLARMRPFLDYQMRCRSMIVPLPGSTNDAKMCNGIRNWLQKYADGGEWVKQRDLKKGIHRLLEELGAPIFERAMRSLRAINAIQMKPGNDKGPKVGRPSSDLVRLAKGL
jgi:hypothetical protein